jgi:hypothetical protein
MIKNQNKTSRSHKDSEEEEIGIETDNNKYGICRQKNIFE